MARRRSARSRPLVAASWPRGQLLRARRSSRNSRGTWSDDAETLLSLGAQETTDCVRGEWSAVGSSLQHPVSARTVALGHVTWTGLCQELHCLARPHRPAFLAGKSPLRADVRSLRTRGILTTRPTLPWSTCLLDLYHCIISWKTSCRRHQASDLPPPWTWTWTSEDTRIRIDFGICPNLVFVNTTSKGDSYENRLPHISAFIRPQATEPQVTRCSANWREVELFFEVQPAEEDPFVDPSADLVGDARKAFSFERASKLASRTRDHMISCAQAQNASQFRTWSFSVFLSDRPARLVRWERGGVFVTESFEWRSNPLFAEFLWRFNHMTSTQRGRDPTVTVPSTDEAAKARDVLTASSHFPDGVPATLHRFLVRDEVEGGRATAGYIALDVQTGACVYLKESWRLVSPDLEKEGNVYRLLHEKGVPHIAPLVCAGDVLSDGRPQCTTAHTYKTARWACKTRTLVPHVHYRIVLGIVGTALDTFSCTRDLCVAIRDAAEAHVRAYELAEVLHRDISIGNILFYKTEDGVIRGILIDWDLCNIRKKESGRQNSRTGTWQFMSGLLLANPKKSHELTDDLESFVHVLTHTLILCRPMENDFLSYEVHRVFDSSFVRARDKVVMGGSGKIEFFLSCSLRNSMFRQALPQPCANIVQDLRNLFAPFYVDDDKDAADWYKRLGAPLKGPQLSEAFLKVFEVWLGEDGWRTDDGCEPVEIPSWERTKRKYSDLSDTSSDSTSSLSNKRRKRYNETSDTDSLHES
ncbi:hypothetical protein FA95DRAFT_370232 [Auriscalpium vulgare]|uniref:Uncharacterized protein n=1 Tax=Auriscalpium vulgare TaxID=40419 RepID=A0ACB8RIS7_9AGAM|nr:hypothetical protein FA95DRAFT_370232 [Auriscalpium vulgare]